MALCGTIFILLAPVRALQASARACMHAVLSCG